MMGRSRSTTGNSRQALAFWRDDCGASALEFAIVAMPFLVLLLSILQVGIYYMTQASLDTGVIRTAEGLRNGFNKAGVPSMPGASTLKSTVVTNSGGMIRNDTTLAVELRQLASLTSATVAITDGTADYGVSTSVLVLRAKTSVFTFAPGLSGLFQASSTALVRRQGR